MTKIIAIETTEKRGSVAVSFDGKVLAYNELPDGQRSAQSLVPTIQATLRQVDWPIKTFDGVAVALGPGSFTGLRVGLATARMLAYSVGAKLIGVNTLQAIAANVCLTGMGTEGEIITTAVDAQRGEVSAQMFQLVPSRHFVGELYPKPIDERRLLTFAEWWALADNGSPERKRRVEQCDNQPNRSLTFPAAIMYAGPILHKIAVHKPDHIQLLDESLWSPNAVGVTRIAWERLFSGESDDLLTLQPYYSRPSAAEERHVRK